MGMFNFLAMFVITAIGVDDSTTRRGSTPHPDDEGARDLRRSRTCGPRVGAVFVFFDAWMQAGQLHGDELEARMDYTYRRAVSAMAITSITDAAAFYTNCLSSITVVKLFGIFMGTLVLVNFALIVSYFPAVVVLTHALPRRGGS